MKPNASEPMEYHQLSGLDNIYLEDSYVLGVEENESEIRFRLELVLTERHPAYSPPKPGEQYAYRRGEIVFPAATEKSWIRKSMHPNPDPSGEPDFGNVDAFFGIGGTYHLSGEWGEIRISSDSPVLHLS